MSDIVQDVGRIWHRLFDHKGFLSGEINFTLEQFEAKREDKEVDQLFSVIESINNIEDIQISRFKQIASETLSQANVDLDKSLELCSKFAELEDDYNKDITIENERLKRKQNWEQFMDTITTTYSEINNKFEAEEEELKESFNDLEKKLHT